MISNILMQTLMILVFTLYSHVFLTYQSSLLTPTLVQSYFQALISTQGSASIYLDCWIQRQST